MHKLIIHLAVAAICVVVLISAGPTLAALLDAAVPLVIAGGLVIALLRIVWHYTGRY